MNKIELLGRLTKTPDIRKTPGENSKAVARFTLAVNRRYKREGEPDADFLPCVAFGKTAEYIEKYVLQGMRVCLTGHVQTGSYEKNGAPVYYTQVVVEEFEVAQSRDESSNSRTSAPKSTQPAAQTTSSSPSTSPDGFMNIPDGIDEDLPFN